MRNALMQAGILGRRAVVRTARQPANVVFPLIFPMLLLAVNAGGLKAETRLPGFPTNSFLAFALAVPFVQGALLATVNANVEFARDIQTGFLNRLALTPVRGLVLLVGQLGGLLTIGFVQAVFYLAVGVAFGVRLETGVAGAALLLLLEAVIALAFASFGSWAALRTGSTEAVQGLFPVFFVFLFLSSMNIPRQLISTTWFRWVATINPVSYLIEAVRSLVIQHWRWETIGLGFAVGAGMSLIGFALATHALVGRLART
ncbi:MAG: ABC transporter permease [Actinobacteria bacterium]|nr:MAG: ABC transporter permease [Actinomycetota bacterium]